MRFRSWGIAALAACAAGHAMVNSAFASETIFPTPPGATVGTPVGALPPPGFYITSYSFAFNYDLKNGSGDNTGIKIKDRDEAIQLLWTPNIEIFGASYGAFFLMPFRYIEIGGILPQSEDLHPINPGISPLNLSWNLHNGFFVSAGVTYYTGSFTWDDTFDPSARNAARNYQTVEPGIGISYLKDGWNLTVHPVIDFNSTNSANSWHSGTLFQMDYTATKKIGEWTVGLGGTYVQQLENDTIDGVTAAAIPGIRSYGNKAQVFNIGPVVAYDLGPVNVSVQYFANVEAKNVGAGDSFWLKINAPLTAPAAAPLK